MIQLLLGFVSWCKVYSLGGNEYGMSGVSIGSRTYVVGYINNGRDAIILKIDSLGDVISHKVYDFRYNSEVFYKIRHFPADNTLFVLGMAGPQIGEKYAVIMKVDTLLNTVWWVGERVAGTWDCCGTNYYSDLFFDAEFSNEISPTSKIIAVGSAEHCDCNENNGKISIYNFDGSAVFRGLYILPSSATYPNSGFSKVLKVGPNKFLAFGYGDWPSDSRIKILAFDTLGNIYWGREIDASEDEDFGAFSATLTPSGDIIGVGGVSGNNGDIFITRFDTAINVSWIYRIPLPGSDFPQDIISLPDGTYLIAGYTNSLGAGGYDGFLMKIDGSGNILWFKTYGGLGDDQFYDIHYTRDGGILLVGSSTSFSGNWDIWVVKADTGGNTCSLCAPLSHNVSSSSISITRYTSVDRLYQIISTYQFISTYSNPSVSVAYNGCSTDVRGRKARNMNKKGKEKSLRK